jgi:Fe-S-cluster-containing dehydrogenase component
LHPDTGVVIACDFCGGEPKCIEACPEEALDVVISDDAAEKRFTDAMDKLPAATEQLMEAVKKKDWKPMLADAEKRGEKVNEKLEALNKKAKAKKKPA